MGRKKKIAALYVWLSANLSRFKTPTSLFAALNSMPEFPKWEYTWVEDHYEFRPAQYQLPYWENKKIPLEVDIYENHQQITYNGIKVEQNRQLGFVLPAQLD